MQTKLRGLSRVEEARKVAGTGGGRAAGGRRELGAGCREGWQAGGLQKTMERGKDMLLGWTSSRKDIDV